MAKYEVLKIPKKISTLIRRKEEFLDQVRSQMENSVIKLQSSLFESIIADIIPRLDVQDGNILDTANNYRLISELEKVYTTFDTKVVKTILPQINKGVTGLVGINEKLFTIVLTGILPKRFESVLLATKKITDLRLGLSGGQMVRGGFLQSILKNDPTQVKQLLSKAVSSQASIRDFISLLRENVTGSAVRQGGMERQFQRFAYDTYQQYDATYNAKLAQEFDMKYFVYQGGLIKDSRDFCAAHNRKVWSIDEAQEWKDWTPSQGDYPDGYEIKAKDVYSVPSYLGYPGYDPLIDRGGYNCRHILSYIPDEMAFRLRPDLKDK